MTEDELVELAQQDYASLQGKIVLVSDPCLGDGNDYDYFYLKQPIRVLLNNRELRDDQMFIDEQKGLLVLDTYYEGEALDPLPRGLTHVTWVDGPSYYSDGTRTKPGFSVPKCLTQ